MASRLLGKHELDLGAQLPFGAEVGTHDIVVGAELRVHGKLAEVEDLPDASAKLTKKLEAAIHKKFGFQSDVILRSTKELRDVITRNPFAKRRDIHPGKLLVTFFSGDPGEEARQQVRAIKCDPEELFIEGREAYIYFPNGAGRSKLNWAVIPKTLKVQGTARNWNSVTKMLEIAEKMES